MNQDKKKIDLFSTVLKRLVGRILKTKHFREK